MRIPRLLAAGVLLTLCTTLSTNIAFAEDKKTTWDITRTTAPDTVDELRALERNIKKVVEKVTPATVALILGRPDPTREEPQAVGTGSGVIISADGYILTAAHVIEPPVFGLGRRSSGSTERATTVSVLLSNQMIVKAQILGRNPSVDSGLAKIIDSVPAGADWPGASEGKWPHVDLGESAKLQQGQWVVAVGHPGGPKPERPAPVRIGQVGKMARSALETDCALVGGDSGGPLFDLNGKLVGIHSRIGKALEENVHVPTKAYQDEWRRLVRGDVVGREGRWGLGAVIVKTDSKEAKIENFYENSPAEQAGLQADDVVVKLNGHDVKTPDDFREIMTQFRANDLATIMIRRAGELIETKVKVIREDPTLTPMRGVMGLIIDRDAKNEARVKSFSKDSPAEKAGLQANDVILKINEKPIANPNDLDKAMERKRPNDVVEVQVRRGEELLDLKIKLTRPSPE